MVAVTRRAFIQSAVGGVWILSAGALSANPSERIRPIASSWCVYVQIRPDNTVVMASPVMDMGQFMRTTAPMILADEMDLQWESIRFSDEVPVYLEKNEKGEVLYSHANMATGGSYAVQRNWDYLRNAGAATRQALIEEAAERWGVDPQRLFTHAGFVCETKSSRRISYGELAERASRRSVDPARVRVKTPDRYRIIGTPQRNIDVRDIVTGKPIFGIDVEYPNALQAVIYRAPRGAKVKTYDKQSALAVPGVVDVFEVQGEFEQHWLSGEDTQIISSGVAIVGESLWAVLEAKRLLNPTWEEEPRYAKQDTELQQQEFRRRVREAADADVTKNVGDVERALADADIVFDQSYEHALLAHACMEPMNCTADVREDAVTLVVGTQFPDSVAKEAERVTGVDATRINVITRRMGGGFGRRSEIDYVREALLLSKRLRRPVKLTWTREDDLQDDYFGPAVVARIRAGCKGGKLTAWHLRHAQTRGQAPDSCFPAGLVEHYKVEFCKSDSLIRVGPWRPPLHLGWAFAVESMYDEIAHALGVDPLQFRLDLMKPHRELPFTSWGSDVIDTGRMAQCYEAAARLAQWHRKRPEGHGLGIAGHFTHGTYTAFVVEVTVDRSNELRILNAWGAIDCGLAINPNHIRSQMEGGFIDGLNAALFNKAEIRAGHMVTTNFDRLRWIRMREAPLDVEVEIIKSDKKPTGVGEPPTPPAPAALANAIFAASGKRLRRMPFVEQIVV